MAAQVNAGAGSVHHRTGCWGGIKGKQVPRKCSVTIHLNAQVNLLWFCS